MDVNQNEKKPKIVSSALPKFFGALVVAFGLFNRFKIERIFFAIFSFWMAQILGHLKG